MDANETQIADLGFEQASFLNALVKDESERPRLARLHELLVTMDARETHLERLEWLESLGRWLHGDLAFALVPTSHEQRTARLELFVRSLSRFSVFLQGFASLLVSVGSELRGTVLFADAGLPVEFELSKEISERVLRALLPQPPALSSYADLAARLFPTADDAVWLETAPTDAWKELGRLLRSADAPIANAWTALRRSLADAARILSVRIAALGVAPEIRDRLANTAVDEISFLKLPPACSHIRDGAGRASLSNEAALLAIEESRASLKGVREHIEISGVSVDLVYRLELMEAQLTRLEQLVRLLVPHRETIMEDLGAFAVCLVRAQFESSSVLELFRRSSHLLARKIVERSGKTGEHYITRTGKEWRGMLLSASGGGALTALTTVAKFMIAGANLPVFFSVLFACGNYAGSFLLMGWLGFTLATKQPSMTAAALAAELDSSDSVAASIERLVTLVAQIVRSQLAAAFGNVGVVIPSVLLIELAWRKTFGHPFLQEDKANYVIRSLHPTRSATFLFAALTGVLLWLSSVGAGWLENWIAYRRLPEAIAEHPRWRRLLGEHRVRRTATMIRHGAASFGGSVTLGVLLGVIGPLGLFFGIGLDVRHVTLSTGSLVFAIASRGPESLLSGDVVFACGSILVIGALNFGVSFALALAVAIRARENTRVAARGLARRLLAALGRRVFERPLEFIVPPADARRTGRVD